MSARYVTARLPAVSLPSASALILIRFVVLLWFSAGCSLARVQSLVGVAFASSSVFSVVRVNADDEMNRRRTQIVRQANVCGMYPASF